MSSLSERRFNRGANLSRAVGIALTVVLFAINAYAQSARLSPGRDRPVPFSSTLPYVALPEGEFSGWCGNDDAFLMREVPGHTRYRLYRRDGYELAAIDLGPDRMGIWPRCDQSAETILFTDGTQKEIFAFHLKSRSVTVPLSYKAAPSVGVIISLASNLKHVAYDDSSIKPDQWITPLELKRHRVSGEKVYWKNDSSMLFTYRAQPWTWTPRADIKTYRETVDVVSTETGQVVSGQIPPGYSVWDGGFANGGNELLLFLKLLPDDQGPGTLFRCRITMSPFSCRAVAPAAGLRGDVEDFSTNERDAAVARAIFDRPRPRPKNDWVPVPDRYIVQVFDGGSRPRHTLRFARPVLLVHARISPTGRLLAVIWRESMCHSEADLPKCQRGVIFSLGDRH